MAVYRTDESFSGDLRKDLVLEEVLKKHLLASYAEEEIQTAFCNGFLVLDINNNKWISYKISSQPSNPGKLVYALLLDDSRYLQILF